VSDKSKLMDALKAFVKSGMPVWGTCAGLIALSDEICDLSGTALSQFSIGKTPRKNEFSRLRRLACENLPQLFRATVAECCVAA